MTNLKDTIVKKVNTLIANDKYIDAAQLTKFIPKIISFVETVFVDGRCINHRANLMRKTGRGDNYISHVIGVMHNNKLIEISGIGSQYLMTLTISE